MSLSYLISDPFISVIIVSLWVCHLAILFQTHLFLLSQSVSGCVTWLSYFRPIGFCYHRQPLRMSLTYLISDPFVSVITDSLWVCNFAILFQTHWFLLSQTQPLGVFIFCYFILDPFVSVITDSLWVCNFAILFQTHRVLLSQSQPLGVSLGSLKLDSLASVITDSPWVCLLTALI